jgi:hypothetical protein
VCGRPPSGATIRRVLLAVDPVAVQAALTRWSLACRNAAAAIERAWLPRNERRQALAVDGKSLHGGRQPDGQQTKLVAVTDHAHRLVLTPLGHRYADAMLRAIWLRGHWQIENTLHWVRAVTSGEDQSAVRTGAGPQAMAVLRNTAINVSRLGGHTNIAAAQRHDSWTPGAAIAAVTSAWSTRVTAGQPHS